jgi:hypothetical protein
MQCTGAGTAPEEHVVGVGEGRDPVVGAHHQRHQLLLEALARIARVPARRGAAHCDCGHAVLCCAVLYSGGLVGGSGRTVANELAC